ncbi:hypothetical protein PsorP6_002208 [Peronosclerospora sorghi]|uniref:Uncharacterized protein n=1 Tax=Peronosclerospora sorghi TaxID=230839 RepID=A0ACC0WW35_9STRA|nr:hypothetical protein PsorP6_002208 [Peronosclerospora sorghi]
MVSRLSVRRAVQAVHHQLFDSQASPRGFLEIRRTDIINCIDGIAGIASRGKTTKGWFYGSCLVKHFPNVEFTWMMGIDNVIDFRKWLPNF